MGRGGCPRRLRDRRKDQSGPGGGLACGAFSLARRRPSDLFLIRLPGPWRWPCPAENVQTARDHDLGLRSLAAILVRASILVRERIPHRAVIGQRVDEPSSRSASAPKSTTAALEVRALHRGGEKREL